MQAAPAPATHLLARQASVTRVLNRDALRTPRLRFETPGRWRATLRLLGSAGRNGGPPILLLLVAFVFLSAQDRIDRNDPKLALAPVHGHQELAFKPVDRETT